MNLRLGSRHFAATLSPDAIHLVEYRREPRRLQVVDYAVEAARFEEPAEATARLAAMILERDGQGARLALAVQGFGSLSQIVSLPAAPLDVLHPVVMRELRHLHPPGTPVSIAFRRTRLEDGRGAVRGQRPEREIRLLVGMIPTELESLMHQVLATSGVELEHLTVLSSALQRVQHAFASADEATALLLRPDASAVLGFFYQGEIHLVSTTAPVRGQEAQPALLEQLERGALFLRQQFRGLSLKCVVISETLAREGLPEAIRERGMRDPLIETLDQAMPDGAQLAFGAALDARSEDGLNLLSAARRPAREADPWVLQLTVVAALVLMLSAGWWGWRSVRVAGDAADRVVLLENQLSARLSEFDRLQRVVRSRASHGERVLVLEPLQLSRERVQEALWRVEQAPTGVRLDSLEMHRAEYDWQVRISGEVRGRSTGESMQILDRWQRELGGSIGAATLALRRLTYPETETETEDGVFIAAATGRIGFALEMAVPPGEGAR